MAAEIWAGGVYYSPTPPQKHPQPRKYSAWIYRFNFCFFFFFFLEWAVRQKKKKKKKVLRVYLAKGFQFDQFISLH